MYSHGSIVVRFINALATLMFFEISVHSRKNNVTEYLCYKYPMTLLTH